MASVQAAFAYAGAGCKMLTKVIQESRFGKVAVRDVLSGRLSTTRFRRSHNGYTPISFVDSRIGTMKIDLGQTITILANVGVIVGIGFLAIELNQNNALLRNEARYNLHLARTEEIEQSALNPGLGELWAKARDGERLTALEREHLGSVILGRFVRWEWYYEQYRNGLIEPEVLPTMAWKGCSRIIRS